MDHVLEIFAALDGPTAIARGLGVPVQTAHYWKSAGSIPEWRRPAILQLTLSKGAALTAGALAYLGVVAVSEPASREAAGSVEAR